MDDSPSQIELGALGKFAAFLCFTAGVSAIFAGGQVAAVVIFRTPWQSALPWLQVGFGLCATYLSLQLAYPRRWALPIAGVVLVGLACGGLPWSWWLLANGVLTALTVFAPGWALLALSVLSAASLSILKIGKLRAEADLETLRLTREATAAGCGYAKAPTGSNGWMLPLLYGVFLVPVGLIVLGIGWPEQFARGETRLFGLLHGRTPLTGFVADRQEYPYPASPFEQYVDYESKFRKLEKPDVIAFVDGIADDVAWHLTAETGERDLKAAEAALWTAGNQKKLPLWIAESLRQHKVFYHLESLLSRSFNPELHVQPDAVHLDCDQLVYVFMHVAYRLDLTMHPVPAPMHVYLRYDGPAGNEPIYVETTEFAKVDVDGEPLPDAPTPHLFIDAKYYPSGQGGTYASAEIIAAAALYEPYAARDIEDEIAANVIEGLTQQGEVVPAAETEAHLEGTHSVTLVTNFYLRYLRAAQRELGDGDLPAAKADATRAHDLRASHGPLIIYEEPKEDEVLVQIAATTGEPLPDWLLPMETVVVVGE